MTVKINFTSINPKKEPVPKQGSWYNMEVKAGDSIGTLLAQFNVSREGIIALKNGVHAGFEEPVKQGDEINFILVVVGG